MGYKNRSDLKDRAQDLINNLIADGNRERVLITKNYCDGVFPKGKIPDADIDNPILHFLSLVAKPCYNRYEPNAGEY